MHCAPLRHPAGGDTGPGHRGHHAAAGQGAAGDGGRCARQCRVRRDLAPGLEAVAREFLVSALCASLLSSQVFSISVFSIWTLPGGAHPRAAGGSPTFNLFWS
jgi:hypothetical protein